MPSKTEILGFLEEGKAEIFALDDPRLPPLEKEIAFYSALLTLKPEVKKSKSKKRFLKIIKKAHASALHQYMEITDELTRE